jgi:hypothetical protein
MVEVGGGTRWQLLTGPSMQTQQQQQQQAQGCASGTSLPPPPPPYHPCNQVRQVWRTLPFNLLKPGWQSANSPTGFMEGLAPPGNSCSSCRRPPPNC